MQHFQPASGRCAATSLAVFSHVRGACVVLGSTTTREPRSGRGSLGRPSTPPRELPLSGRIQRTVAQVRPAATRDERPSVRCSPGRSGRSVTLLASHRSSPRGLCAAGQDRRSWRSRRRLRDGEPGRRRGPRGHLRLTRSLASAFRMARLSARWAMVTA